MGADRGSTAIGSLAYQRRPEAAGLPISLSPRPVFLASRDGLLAELEALLTSEPPPRVVALHGLGGVGKISVAVEYVHRHLAIACRHG